MFDQEYTLEEISFLKKEDCRILETVLKNWFSDPKTLNYVDPRMSFPFQFKKWVALSYEQNESTTIVLKKDDWIIGYLSMKSQENRGHLFHLFIDPSHRQQGLGQKMIQSMENFGRENGLSIFTLNVVPKNIQAIQLYKKMGYKEEGVSGTGSLKMVKNN